MRVTRRPVGVLGLAAAALSCALFLAKAHRHLAAEPGLKEQFDDYARSGEPLLHGIGIDAQRATFRMPLSSVLAAALENHSPVSLKAAAFAIFSAEALLVLALGYLLLPPASFGAPLALLLLTILMKPAFFSHVCLEAVFALSVLAVAAALAWRARAPSPRRTLLLAAALGVSLLVRSPLAFFPPLLALWDCFFDRRPRPERRTDALILCLVPYLFLAPWAQMNWRVHRRLVVLEDSAADTNVVTGALGLVRTVEGDEVAMIDRLVPARDRDHVARWALRETARHPIRFLLAAARRAAWLVVWQPLLILFAAYALWIHRRSLVYQELGLLCAYFAALHCLFPIQERYFFPLWPATAALSAAAVASAWSAGPADAGAAEYRAAEFIVWGFAGLTLAASLWTEQLVRDYGRLALPGSSGTGPVNLDKVKASDVDWDPQIRSYPREAWLRFERGRARLESGDVPAAIADLSEAARLEPANPAYGLTLAWADMLGGDPEPMMSRPVEPRDLAAHLLKARAYLRLRRVPEARANLAAAVAIHSAMIDAPDRATAEGEAAAQGLRGYSDGFVERLAFYGRSGPLAERLDYVRELLRLIPDSPPLRAEKEALTARLAERAAPLFEYRLPAFPAGGELFDVPPDPAEPEQLRASSLARKVKRARGL